MLPSFELREIGIFLTVAEELSFSRAAERCGVTSSRVSQVVAKLERRMGGRLFDRSSRHVGLTPLGESLRIAIAPAFHQLVDAYDAARASGAGSAQRLRIGMYLHINGGPHFAELVRRFEAGHPGWRVQTVDTAPAGISTDSLLHGEVDVMAHRLPVDDSDIVIGPLLSREERVLAVATDHPLVDRDRICFEDLADYCVPHVSPSRPELLDAFIPPRTASGRLVRRRRVETFGEVMMLVASGELVHPTVPSYLEHFRHPQVTAIPIVDLPPSETALIWRADDTRGILNSLARAAEEVVGPMVDVP